MAIALLATAACGGSDDASEEDGSTGKGAFEYTDARGESVSLDERRRFARTAKYAERAVALSRSCA